MADQSEIDRLGEILDRTQQLDDDGHFNPKYIEAHRNWCEARKPNRLWRQVALAQIVGYRYESMAERLAVQLPYAARMIQQADWCLWADDLYEMVEAWVVELREEETGARRMINPESMTDEQMERYRHQWRPGIFATEDGPEARWIIGSHGKGTVINVSLGDPPGSSVKAYVFDRDNDVITHLRPEPTNAHVEQERMAGTPERVAAALIEGYLTEAPNFDGWHQIDNVTADTLREMVKQLLKLQQETLLAADLQRESYMAADARARRAEQSAAVSERVRGR